MSAPPSTASTRLRASGRRAIHGRLLASVLAAAAAGPLAAQQGLPPARVVTAPVTRESVADEVAFPGTILPWLESLVAAEIEGRVLSRQVEEGDRVRRGAPLVRLDAVRLDKSLAVARAEETEVAAQLHLAERREVRARELHQSNVLPDGDLDAAISERAAFAARLERIEARIASIEDDLERSVIRAPIDGVVTDLHIEMGEWIDRGEPVARLSNLDTLKIRLEVPDRYFPFLEVGAPAPASVDALSGLELDGKVFAVVPRADEEARTFPVLVRAANPGGRAAAGMLARVRLRMGDGNAVLVVPKDAVVRAAGRTSVFVADDGTARAVSVETGRAIGSRVEVRGELSAGDRVVVRGNERLMPGQPVIEDTADAGEGPAAEPKSN